MTGGASEPHDYRISDDQEVRVQDILFRIVKQRLEIDLDDLATRLLHHALRGGRIPFGSQAKARIDIRLALGD